MNSNILDTIPDPGKDGVRTSLYSWNQPGLHARVANDAFGYSLSYFDTANGVREYHPIGKRIDIASNNLLASLSPNAALHGNNPSGDAPNLYNGNIRAMVTSLYDITPNAGTPRVPQVTGYRYDQLNRVTQMKAYRGLDTTNTGTYNTWGSGSSDGSYTTHIAYDDNGNILKMERNGSASSTHLFMDSLTYYYNSGTNKLNHVIDSVAASNYSTDIDSQAVNNYDYDEIGNLTRDLKDSIASITWTVYGKVKKVNRVGGCTMPNLEFRYDASGNRVTKIVKPHNYTSDGDTSHWTKTYYVRDAQGNIMSTYTDVDTDTHLYLSEQMIYGSKRAAVLNRSIDLSTFVVPCSTCANYSDRELGQKQFEMDNHLGNVLASVTDRKLPVSDGAGTPKTRCYLADITSMNDYGVWGDLLPKRNVSSTAYRFGFNGKEKEDETYSSTGSSYTTEFREYDSRLGRWLSIDPEVKNFPWQSPYAAFDDNPILKSDPKGDAAGDPEKLKTAAEKGVESAKAVKEKTKSNSACNIGVQSAVSSYTDNKVNITGNANKMADDFATGKYEDFQKIDVDITTEEGKKELQDKANQGELIIGIAKKEGDSGHTIMLVPGEMSTGDQWKGGGKMPQVMDTGNRGNNKQVPMTGVSGQSTVKAMVFYIYKPVLKNSNSPTTQAKAQPISK